MDKKYKIIEKIQGLSIYQLSNTYYEKSGKLITVKPQEKKNIFLKNSIEIIKKITRLMKINSPQNKLNLLENNYSPQPEKKLTVREKANLRLAYYWLKIYQPEPGTSNLEKVKGYLQAFRHFAKMGEWEKASQILSLKLPLVDENLDTQLNRWGYYEECMELYNKLLGKLDQSWDGICLNGLGNAYLSLGKYHKAIEHYQQHLQIAKEIGDLGGQGIALGNLGDAYHSLEEYNKAIEYHQQHLQIAKETGELGGEGIALGNLGSAYYSLGKYHKAIECHQQHLQITKEIGNMKQQGIALGNLGNAYHSLGAYHKAMEYHQQDLEIVRKIGDLGDEGIALGNLGNAYYSLGVYHKAIEYHQQHLQIARKIGNVKQEGIALGNLGNAYHSLGAYHKA
ncbi:MAG: tetratricopeptide repeat protein, partial [Trichodesmium sp. St19_bin2]|nr:tetratricopeptide repeat protein [Trichodesmium sp. St19_bin2]